MTTLATSGDHAADLLVKTGLGILAFVGAMIGARVAWKIARQKPRLVVGVSQKAPLLNASQASRIIVMHDGRELTQPWILEIKLINVSKRDIRVTDFENGVPIELNVNAHINSVLRQESRPATKHVPDINVDGTVLKVEPGLISGGQEVSYSVLVDGSEPEFTHKEHLAAVDVVELHNADTFKVPKRLETAWGIARIALVIVFFLGLLRVARVLLDYAFSWLGA